MTTTTVPGQPRGEVRSCGKRHAEPTSVPHATAEGSRQALAPPPVDTAPAKPVDPTPEAAFEIADRQRSGNTGMTIRVSPKVDESASLAAAGIARASKVLSDARAAFLQSDVMQELNGLRDRMRRAHDNHRDAKNRAAAARADRAAALAAGKDDLLDALDAKIEAADGDAARYGARVEELHKLIAPVEARAKEGLANVIATAAHQHAMVMLVEQQAAERRLTIALSAPLVALVRAEEDCKAAARVKSSMQDQFTNI